MSLNNYLVMRAIKCCSVVFGVTLRLFVINTASSSSPAINKLRCLQYSDKCHNLRDRGPAAPYVLATPSRSQRCQHAVKRDMWDGKMSISFRAE